MASERQLLQVWNPLVEPLTVKLHVDKLVSAPAAQRYVWWGRIYVGNREGALTPDGAAAKWPRVAGVAQEMRETGREIAVLTTNFKSLHALRVDEIRFGTDAVRSDGARLPTYYRERPVAIWFRVRDVAPITHDQNATLAWLDANTLFDAHAAGYPPFAYDPYRAMRYDYPIALQSAPTTSLFDPARLQSLPAHLRLFAAQPGTVFPPDLESAMSSLAKDIDPPWSSLDEASKVFLASASVVEALLRESHGEHRAMEPSAAMILMAKAVESECRALLRALRETGATRLVPEIDRAMLGDMSDAIRMLEPVARDLGSAPLLSLAKNTAWLDWLTSFGKARNRAAHAERLPVDEFERHRAALYARGSSRLAPLATAKRDLQNR